MLGMDVNSFLSNELGVVAYSILTTNGGSAPQNAETLVTMPTGLSPGDAQWIPDGNGSVLLTFSAISGIPQAVPMKPQAVDSSTTFLPFVPSLILTENGTLLSGELQGSPHPVTLLDPSAIDSPQIVVDSSQIVVDSPHIVIESPQIVIDNPQTVADSPQTIAGTEPSPGDHASTSVFESRSENGHIPTIVNAEFSTSEKGLLSDDSFNDIVSVVTLYKCKLCKFKCEDKGELSKHLDGHKNKSSSTKSKRKSIQAKLIDTTVPQEKKDVGNPSRAVEGEDCNTHMFFSCGACLKVCTSMDELSEHMKKIHGIQKEEDDEEEAVVGSEEPPRVDLSASKVIETIADVNNESDELKVETASTPIDDGLRELKFQCTMCKLRFSTRLIMDAHRKCHNPEYTGPGLPKFKCLICSQGYNRWAFCKAHLWLVHQMDSDLYTCIICDFKTVYRDKYICHQQRHRHLKEYACRFCAKQFCQKTQLRNHEVLHMRKNIDAKLPEWVKPKECDHCHKTFSDSKALKKHVKTVHSKLKPYVCQVCGHCSARKAMFQLHVRQHTGEKPFACSACDFTTGDHNSLRRHTMRHTGVRQYQCKFCSYSAIQAQMFKHHLIKKHGGDGVFQCNICSFSTLNEQSFIYHHHDDDQKPEKAGEDKPTLIYVPFSEKDRSNKKGSGELIAINVVDDEESNNFFDHEAAIDTGGITIVEDVEEDIKPVTSASSLSGQVQEGMDVTTVVDMVGSEEAPDSGIGASFNTDIATSQWGILCEYK